MLVKSRMLPDGGYECSVAAIIDNFTSANGGGLQLAKNLLPRAALEQMLRELRSAVRVPTASLENMHPLIAIRLPCVSEDQTNPQWQMQGHI